MPADTILLYFTVDTCFEMKFVKDVIESVLHVYFKQLVCLCDTKMNDGSQVLLYSEEGGTLVTVRIFKGGLLTLNIEYFYEENEIPLLSYQEVQNIESVISLRLKAKRSKSLPAVKRGTAFDPYLNSYDDRLIEFDFDRFLFEEDSPYQNVQIVHSKTFGNMLILDGYQNLSEKDGIYTETLMFCNFENYEDKEIVILGGGDGALLNALLKKNPKYVRMFELDDVVIKACAQYLRSCCGNVLDTTKGDKYEIVIGDCLENLDNMVKNNQCCDYVFGDLTDIPLQIDSKQEGVWNMFERIIDLSFRVLKPDGKFITHCCGITNVKITEELENLFRKFDPNIKFRRATAFVPSFMEDWVFYTVWR